MFYNLEHLQYYVSCTYIYIEKSAYVLYYTMKICLIVKILINKKRIPKNKFHFFSDHKK